MKSRPILFSSPMVRALLDGTKTQTRRMIKPQPEYTEAQVEVLKATHPDKTATLSSMFNAAWQDGFIDVKCPYGVPRDRLWVKEGVAFIDNSEFVPADDPLYQHWEYRADGDFDRLPGEWPDDQKDNPDRPHWRSPLHCPRIASRITLEITAVRVQRVQDISQDDAVAEGCDDIRDMKLLPGRVFYAGGPRDAYSVLWESINGAGSWDVNPWVWAISFRKVTP